MGLEMRTNRIVLAAAGFAGIAAICAGTPVASADITGVSAHYGVFDLSWGGSIAVTTTDCALVRITVDGKYLPSDPFVPVSTRFSKEACIPGATNYVDVGWQPSTPGRHRIEVVQRDADGKVISTKSIDYNVECPTGMSGGCRGNTGSF